VARQFGGLPQARGKDDTHAPDSAASGSRLTNVMLRAQA
jgi:hypothetical protein